MTSPHSGTVRILRRVLTACLVVAFATLLASTTAPAQAPTAGSCTAVGTWVHNTSDIGSTTWTISPGGQAREAGIGNATGTATLSGQVLSITFVASDTVTTGVYRWTLGPDCRSGAGTLMFTGPPSRAGQTHASTVAKTGGPVTEPPACGPSGQARQAQACAPTPTCVLRPATIVVVDNPLGANIAVGTPGDDVIVGTAGDDLILGGGGGDRICGLGGDDTLNGGGGADFVRGGPGRDRLIGGVGDAPDSLQGGPGVDAILGGGGDDRIRGDDDPDRIAGGDDRDVILGGHGGDRITGNGGNDHIEGGDGSDFILGRDGNDLLVGDDRKDILRGGEGNDRIFGGEGGDLLDGGEDFDEGSGNAGNDDCREIEVKDSCEF